MPLPPLNGSIGLATVRNDHAILLDPLLGPADGRGVTVIYTMLGRLDHYASQSINSRITWVARFIYRHYFRIHFDQFVAKGSPSWSSEEQLFEEALRDRQGQYSEKQIEDLKW